MVFLLSGRRTGTASQRMDIIAEQYREEKGPMDVSIVATQTRLFLESCLALATTTDGWPERVGKGAGKQIKHLRSKLKDTPPGQYSQEQQDFASFLDGCERLNAISRDQLHDITSGRPWTLEARTELQENVYFSASTMVRTLKRLSPPDADRAQAAMTRQRKGMAGTMVARERDVLLPSTILTEVETATAPTTVTAAKIATREIDAPSILTEATSLAAEIADATLALQIATAAQEKAKARLEALQADAMLLAAVEAEQLERALLEQQLQHEQWEARHADVDEEEDLSGLRLAGSLGSDMEMVVEEKEAGDDDDVHDDENEEDEEEEAKSSAPLSKAELARMQRDKDKARALEKQRTEARRKTKRKALKAASVLASAKTVADPWADVAAMMAAVIPSPEQVALLEERVARTERILGPESLTLFGEMSQLATLHLHRKSYKAVLLIYERLVKIGNVNPELGPDHSDTLDASSTLASMMRCTGQYADAEAVERRVLDAHRRVLGEGFTMVATLNLILSIAFQGRVTEARQMMENGLPGWLHFLPKSPNGLDRVVRQLADLLEYEGKLEDSKVRFPVIVGISRYLKTNSSFLSHHYRQY